VTRGRRVTHDVLATSLDKSNMLIYTKKAPPKPPKRRSRAGKQRLLYLLKARDD
jgi:hypothetical protein